MSGSKVKSTLNYAPLSPLSDIALALGHRRLSVGVFLIITRKNQLHEMISKNRSDSYQNIKKSLSVGCKDDETGRTSRPTVVAVRHLREAKCLFTDYPGPSILHIRALFRIFCEINGI